MTHYSKEVKDETFKLFTILLTLIVVIVGIQTAAFAASKLEAAAIKESKVIWYGSRPKN